MNGIEERWPGRASVPTDVDLDRVWLAVATTVWWRRVGLIEKTIGRLLRSPGLARALVTTPSLLLPWLISTAAVLGAGIAATFGTHELLVALVAPAVGATGIAFAYGPGIDPAWELNRSMAVSEQMVLLLRGVAVFSVNALLGLVATAVCEPAAMLTFAWLLPMAAVSALALAVATVAQSAPVGAGAGVACWSIAVLSGRAASGHFLELVTGVGLFLPELALIALCLIVVIHALRSPRGVAS
jgi:hypothetical protein